MHSYFSFNFPFFRIFSFIRLRNKNMNKKKMKVLCVGLSCYKHQLLFAWQSISQIVTKSASNNRTNANTFRTKANYSNKFNYVVQWKWRQVVSGAEIVPPRLCAFIAPNWAVWTGVQTANIIPFLRRHLHRDKCKIYIVHSIAICIWMNKTKNDGKKESNAHQHTQNREKKWTCRQQTCSDRNGTRVTRTYVLGICFMNRFCLRQSGIRWIK